MPIFSRPGGALFVAVLWAFTAGASNLAAQSDVPSGWLHSDIGGPSLPGAATASAGVFTVDGTGRDIWDSSDQFHFVYKQATGDTEIVAWVSSLHAAEGWSKAGVMVRGALTGSAVHASLFTTGSNGWAAQQRTSVGGMSDHRPGTTGAAPGWVRLVREGHVFSTYQSPDGSVWTLVSAERIEMPATVYVGLAVSSHNPSSRATATFGNVSISTPGGANKPPTVTIVAPSDGTTSVAGGDVTISAVAADADGTITRVDFRAGDILVGSDTTSPFAAVWKNVPEGTHNLTAAATDNDGETTVSPAVRITVTPAANRPPTVAIVDPIADTNSTAPARIGITATAQDSDGSVAKVDFYSGATLIASDGASPFTADWSDVSTGTYTLTAVATDNAGARTTSAPIRVTVGGAAPGAVMTSLLFTAPADYASNVTSSLVEIRRSSDTASAPRVGAMELGKPGDANGEITVNLSTLVNSLPTDSYYATVISTGPGGSTRSEPSGVFRNRP